MRHIGRTHGVCVRWLHERFNDVHNQLHYCPTDKQCADIFTKAFDNPEKWAHAHLLVNVLPSAKMNVKEMLELHDYSRVLADDPTLRKSKEKSDDVTEGDDSAGGEAFSTPRAPSGRISGPRGGTKTPPASPRQTTKHPRSDDIVDAARGAARNQ